MLNDNRSLMFSLNNFLIIFYLRNYNFAISPSSSEYSLFQLTDKEYYESPEYYIKLKILTVLMGEVELECGKFKKLIEKAQTYATYKDKII